MRYALIGKKLSHSFSKDIHSFFGVSYDYVELAEEEIADFVKENRYDGFNVTVPYKEILYKTVDSLDETAFSVGSVNTVIYKDGKTVGYNTDLGGMRYMLKKIGCSVEGKTVLVLGSGGTSKTAQALCRADGAKAVFVCSRTGDINYNNVYDRAEQAEVLINCTPVGMYPDLCKKVVEISRFGNLKYVADCIYNPLKTELVSDAEAMNIAVTNGLSMLVAQAVYAEEIWQGKQISEKIIEELTIEILKKKSNIVLVGMPGSGKSTVGKLLSAITEKPFFDADEEIERLYDAPKKIISEKGEGAFRKIEMEVLDKLTATGGKVIATGGGAVISAENRKTMRRNGTVIYIDRELSRLSTAGRPLSLSQGVEKLYEERKDLYEEVCDKKINNDGDIDSTVKEIVCYYENFGN